MNETFYSDTKNIYSGKVTQYQVAKTMVDFLQTLFGISFADTEILFLIYLFVKSQLKKSALSRRKLWRYRRCSWYRDGQQYG